jgi:O-methyltransferase
VDTGKKTLRFLARLPVMAPVRRLVLKTVERTSGMQLVPLEVNGNQLISDLVEQVSDETEMLLSSLEASQIYQTVRALSGIKGDLAEVGVYRGASSRIIREAEPLKPLHLFDTFEGLPKPSAKDDAFSEGLYRASLQGVQGYLSRYRNVHFYPGLFPQTAEPVINTRFSFVHLDVDLYDSTLRGLEFFWPRLQLGGAILSHDYSTSPGVRSAFQEFFSGRAPVFPLAHSQCLVIRAEGQRREQG